MDVLLVIDMQEAALRGGALHEISRVTSEINALATSVRADGGAVVFVQHDGASGTPFEPGIPTWKISQTLDLRSDDLCVRKSLNDAFAGTDLAETLRRLETTRLLVAGQATDFCVDTTVRSAVSRRFPVVVASDCHTLRDRPHLSAAQVIQHHNWVWANLYAPASIHVIPAAQVCQASSSAGSAPAA